MRDPGFAARLIRDFRDASLEDPDIEMLEYAVKLTREPWAVEETDVNRLREAGFTDRAILDIAVVVAYYAFVNRLAQGLGVRLEEFLGVRSMQRS